jgi:hypothetical protein
VADARLFGSAVGDGAADLGWRLFVRLDWIISIDDNQQCAI